MDYIKIKFLAKNVIRNFLILKVKVFMLPYHIALDVIATNLYAIFFIDIMFSNILQKNHEKLTDAL